MIDLHFHCLPGIDDGPDSWDEAVALCRQAAAEGTTSIVATPHVLRDGWLNEDPRERDELIRTDVAWAPSGVFVAQRLAGDPVLAIRTVKIATEHSEAERGVAGKRVEERLLFDRIDLQRADVAKRDPQFAVSMKTHAADAVATGPDPAAMPTCPAQDPPVTETFDQLRRRRTRSRCELLF